jgi:poly-gamma-glutamate synthesis protein (capsule biosynthesis protein)
MELFGVAYKVGDKVGTKTFEMNKEDLTGILHAVRAGKYFSNFMMVSCHCHQGPIEAQEWLFEDQTPDFLIDFAHQVVDNGADVFVGHGPHVLRGIEIYKGKPIYYGLGEYVREWHEDSMLTGSFWAAPNLSEQGGERGPGGGNGVGDPERVSTSYRQVNYESVVAVAKYDKGQLVEVRLYPSDGGFDGPVSMLGIPRTASPAVAQRILTRLQALSKPFGTNIAIENNVGVIRVGSTLTSSK